MHPCFQNVTRKKREQLRQAFENLAESAQRPTGQKGQLGKRDKSQKEKTVTNPPIEKLGVETININEDGQVMQMSVNANEDPFEEEAEEEGLISDEEEEDSEQEPPVQSEPEPSCPGYQPPHRVEQEIMETQ